MQTHNLVRWLSFSRSKLTPLLRGSFLFGCGMYMLIPNHLAALIHYAADNQKNLAPPSYNSLPFDSVARICNRWGKNTTGSAVHIRNGYLLTAKHVKIRTHVTFDGNKLYKIDTSFNPIQVSNADLKIIRLTSHPELPKITLFDKPHGDTKVAGWVVGWGLGFSQMETGLEHDNQSRAWRWGDEDTIAKRWGTNHIMGYSEWHTGIKAPLITKLDTNSGADEAGLTMYDSGAGLFVLDAQTWKLAGVAIRAHHGESLFASRHSQADQNHYVRVYYYKDDIDSIIQKHQNTRPLETASTPKKSTFTSVTTLLCIYTGEWALFLFLIKHRK